MTDEYLSVKQAARIAGVSKRSVFAWIKHKLLPVYRLPSNGPRVLRSDLLKIEARR